MVAGRAAEVPAAKKYVIGYVGRKDKPYTFSHAEICALRPPLVEFAENPPIFSGIMGGSSIHLPFRNETEVRGIAAAVRQTGQSVMNRNIVILSPHFPPHYHRFWLSVKQAGANALGIGDEPYEALARRSCVPR